MNRVLSIIIAVALVIGGVGVVRPEAGKRVAATWEPVVDSMTRAPIAGGDYVELAGPADYVIFIEGPTTHAVWDAPSSGVWVELMDEETRQCARSTTHGADYDYEVGPRRGSAIARVSIPRTTNYRLDVTGSDLGELFEISIGGASSVDESAWRASSWKLGGIAVCVLMGLGAVLLIRRPEN